MKIYRAMTPDTDGFPRVGRSARLLGVRLLDRLPHNDVKAEGPDDIVNPGKGMSAAPNDPAHLPKNRRLPQVNGGMGKTRCGRSTPMTWGQRSSTFTTARPTASFRQ